ncbi:hypothetical protein Scep_028597 [Stephania cephalantha]|uniref:Uncharacterized protein n=1 Tax=Stephania cephalantha TaxID=152367 RepID=A0AAP0EA86_9MAGN
MREATKSGRERQPNLAILYPGKMREAARSDYPLSLLDQAKREGKLAGKEEEGGRRW